MIVSLAAGIYQMYLIYAPGRFLQLYQEYSTQTLHPVIEPEGQPPRINYVTPFYCVFLAVWATLYLEYWKRKNAAVAHKWGVRYRRERLVCLLNLHFRLLTTRNANAHVLSSRAFGYSTHGARKWNFSIQASGT